ncbi:hypothetical protein MKZ38_001452 [Zalerion maritima]|uniref:Calmodulin n=1 Tax=Zalerion maritima TaxID=339359 RepID=A0AAD5RYS4_9PEZI|nr:hypothetical protein MKZ38_001452 [Zalerion maritima]
MNPASQSYPGRPFTQGGASNKIPDRSAYGTRLGGLGGGLASQSQQQGGPSNQQHHIQNPAGGASMREEYFSQLSEEQRDEINEAFVLFDVDKDTRIDFHEFKVALKALGFDLSKPELLSLLTSYGQPPLSWQPQPSQQECPTVKLQLTQQSWQTIAGRLVYQRDPRDEIMRAFALFDNEEKGLINLDDLRRVARELGEALEEEELAAMIEEFDLEGKGGVNQEEFVSILLD